MTVPMFADASVPNPEPAPRDLDAAFGTKQHASSGDDSTPRSVPPGRAQAEAMLGKVDAALAASKTFKASSPNSALESPNSGEDDGVFPDEARVVPAGPPDGSSTYPLAASDAETPRESTAPREGVPGAGATPDVRGESTAALATGVGERPSAADLVRAGDGGGAGDASAADDPSAAPDLDAETRAACLARFVATDDEGRLAELRAMGQKELQETFRAAFRRATTSNNNQWLRRRIAGAMGLERLVGGASHAGAAGASARKSSLAGLQAPAGTTGPAGGFLPARAGSGLEKAGGTIVAEDGVRKSSRTAKPKIRDFLPSAVCVKVANEAPGESAVGRRVRVFWPAEGAFYAGLVVGFDFKSAKHRVRYDDGDVEDVLLAAERIEWIQPGVVDESKLAPTAPATAAGGGALSSKASRAVSLGSALPRRIVHFALPAPGKPAEVLAELGASWPSTGAHVWGRVKGHGWWPGVVQRPEPGDAAEKDAAQRRRVRFFDDTAASVHRHDLVPYREYRDALSKAKKSVGFVTAVRLAEQSVAKAVAKEKRKREESMKALNTNGDASERDADADAKEGEPPSSAKRKDRDGDASTDGGRPGGEPLGTGPDRKRPARGGSPEVANGVVAELEDGARARKAAPPEASSRGALAVPAASNPDPKRFDLAPDGTLKPKIKRSHKKGQGLKARAAAEAAGLPWPPPKPAGVGRGNKAGASRGANERANKAAGNLFGNANPNAASRRLGGGMAYAALGAAGMGDQLGGAEGMGDQLGLLSRKLDALHTRVTPLAIAASQYLRKQLQLSRSSAARGGQVPPAAMMTEGERATLLEELEALHRLLSWSGGGGGAGSSVATPSGDVRDIGEEIAAREMMFVHEQYGGAGANADAAAAEKAARDGSDPDFARLDARWERGGLDPIEMAMLDAENVGVAGVPVSMMDAGEVDIQQLGNMMDGVPPPQVVETEYRGAKEGEYRWDAAADAYKYRDSDDEGEALDPAALLASGPSGDFSAQVVADAQATPATQAQQHAAAPAAAAATTHPMTASHLGGFVGEKRRPEEVDGAAIGAARAEAASALGGGDAERERSPARSPAPAAASTPPAPAYMGAPRRAPSPALSDTTQ